MTTLKAITSALIASVSLSACSNEPYQPILDGPATAAYQSDLAACRQVAAQKKKTKEGVTAGAIVGGLIGAADADSGDALAGAIGGAIIGGLIGSTEEQSDVNKKRDAIVYNCLRGRGHKVVG